MECQGKQSRKRYAIHEPKGPVTVLSITNIFPLAGMWDSHFRVGGASGTNLQLSNCPKLTGAVNKNCMAATMLFHVTSYASGYFENVWAWVADHDIEYEITNLLSYQ